MFSVEGIALLVDIHVQKSAWVKESIVYIFSWSMFSGEGKYCTVYFPLEHVQLWSMWREWHIQATSPIALVEISSSQ
jgi:hypothetical protein